jgi:hypothetical protein
VEIFTSNSCADNDSRRSLVLRHALVDFGQVGDRSKALRLEPDLLDPDSLEQVVSVVLEERRVDYHVYLLRIDLALLMRSISK